MYLSKNMKHVNSNETHVSNIFGLLPLELSYKIFSYLPICTPERQKLCKSIRTLCQLRSLRKYYKSMMPDEYDDWLMNDIGRWLNDDLPLMDVLRPRYRRYAAKAFKVPETYLNSYVKICGYESHIPSFTLVQMYAFEFTEEDLNSCVHFILNLYI